MRSFVDAFQPPTCQGEIQMIDEGLWIVGQC